MLNNVQKIEKRKQPGLNAMEENPIGGKVAGRLLYREVKIVFKNESIRRFDPHRSVRVKYVMSVKSVIWQVYEKDLLN